VTVIFIDPINLGIGKLDLGTRRAKELLSNNRTDSLGRNALDPDDDPIGERSSDRP